MATVLVYGKVTVTRARHLVAQVEAKCYQKNKKIKNKQYENAKIRLSFLWILKISIFYIVLWKLQCLTLDNLNGHKINL